MSLGPFSLTHQQSDQTQLNSSKSEKNSIQPNQPNPYVHSTRGPLPSISQHLSYDDCLEDKREDYQNCSVLYCVTQ